MFQSVVHKHEFPVLQSSYYVSRCSTLSVEPPCQLGGGRYVGR